MKLNREQSQAEEKAAEGAVTNEKPAQFDVLMAFLDADTYEEKLDILYRMQPVPGEGIHGEVRVALSNSLGFGGHNATLAVKKFEA